MWLCAKSACCCAVVRIAAGRLHPKVAALHGAGRVEWAAHSFSPELLDTAFLAVAATDDSDLNERVFQAAQSRRLLVNTVDDPARCNFIFPSIIDRSPIQIAISSGGKAPVLARLLRENAAALQEANARDLARASELSAPMRERLKLTPAIIETAAQGCEQLAAMPDVIGEITGRTEPMERVSGSVAAALFAYTQGAAILRVHDVRETADALKVWQTLASAA